MFKIKSVDVKVVFIVNPKQKDNFLEWIYTLGFTWFRWDWEKFVQRMESIDCIAILTDDPRLHKLIDRLNDPENYGKFYWFVSCDELMKSVNFFAHYLYNRKDEWSIFLNQYQKKTNERFNEKMASTNT